MSQEVRQVGECERMIKDTKSLVLDDLAAAQSALQRAYQRAVTATPLAQDLPVFVEVQRLAKCVGVEMQAVARLRGL